tara:strand:- start:8061 stop:8435 length:375 start_codon:yes stop_codon:yes gene_type:complete
MQNVNTINQSKDKITSVNGYWISTVTCFNEDNDDSVTIQLTGLEAMWYNHEENIDHPEGSDYPTGINEPHRKLMIERVANSILARTGIDIANYDNVIHASTSPGRNPDGSFIESAMDDKIVRNV